MKSSFLADNGADTEDGHKEINVTGTGLIVFALITIKALVHIIWRVFGWNPRQGEKDTRDIPLVSRGSVDKDQVSIPTAIEDSKTKDDRYDSKLSDSIDNAGPAKLSGTIIPEDVVVPTLNPS